MKRRFIIYYIPTVSFATASLFVVRLEISWIVYLKQAEWQPALLHSLINNSHIGIIYYMVIDKTLKKEWNSS